MLREQLRAFAAERDWDQFHSPKNLAMALAAEAGELLEIFQWLTEAQSRGLAPDAQASGKRRGRGRSPVPDPAERRAGHRSDRGGPSQAPRERREVSGGQGARQQQEVHGALAWTRTRSCTGPRAARQRSARWRSERGAPPPRRVVIADDRTTADACVRPRLPGQRALVAGRLPERAADADRAGEPRGPSARASPSSRRHPQRRRRPPRPSICTARRSRSARARWACC